MDLAMRTGAQETSAIVVIYAVEWSEGCVEWWRTTLPQ